jgi:glycerol kinase
VRAALEAQAYQTLDLMDAMRGDTGSRPHVMRADGGLIANSFVAQFLADMLETDIEVPKVTETTAWGAACLAGLQAGMFDGLEDIAACWRGQKIYRPKMQAKARKELYAGWQQAIKQLI